MHPELFKIPFTEITVKSYGVMLVIGFLFAVYLMRRIARRVKCDPENVTNVALYALISGVIGCRAFYVIHHWDQFRDNLWDIIAVWQGGLEFIGGVFLAIIVIVIYHRLRPFPARFYMDIMAIGLMLGLGFGRVGCLLNGCCFGKPADVPWAIRFPYDSHPYNSQIRPDLSRDRREPHLDLPAEYFGYIGPNGEWITATEAGKHDAYLKPMEELTAEQRREVTEGIYRCLPAQPTQIYSSINAFILCGILYVFFMKFGRYRPGTTFSLMFMLYGLTRFGLEFIREGNPFESGWWTLTDHWTISQNLGIYLAISGAILFVIYVLIKPRGQYAVCSAGDGGKTKPGKRKKLQSQKESTGTNKTDGNESEAEEDGVPESDEDIKARKRQTSVQRAESVLKRVRKTIDKMDE